MKKVTFIFKNGQKMSTTGEEVVYYASSGSLYVDGEQTVIYEEEIADDCDIVGYTVEEMIDMGAE